MAERRRTSKIKVHNWSSRDSNNAHKAHHYTRLNFYVYIFFSTFYIYFYVVFSQVNCLNVDGFLFWYIKK